MNFDWDPIKNIWLKENRNITFDEIICLINEGFLIKTLKHPKKSHQKIFIINRDGYAYNVPFIEETEGKCFLKTIYPSRASTKKYIGGNNE